MTSNEIARHLQRAHDSYQCETAQLGREAAGYLLAERVRLLTLDIDAEIARERHASDERERYAPSATDALTNSATDADMGAMVEEFFAALAVQADDLGTLGYLS